MLTSEYPSMQIGQLTVPEGLEHSASCQCRASADIGRLSQGRPVRSLALQEHPGTHRRAGHPQGVSGATRKGERRCRQPESLCPPHSTSAP